MTFEVIIAPDRERSNAYALAKGWRASHLDLPWYYRTEPAPDWKISEDLTVPTVREIRIKIVATPMALEEVPRGTRVHIAGFPGGVPAAWAKALSRHDVVKDPA